MQLVCYTAQVDWVGYISVNENLMCVLFTHNRQEVKQDNFLSGVLLD